jgi:hypothetical protein
MLPTRKRSVRFQNEKGLYASNTLPLSRIPSRVLSDSALCLLWNKTRNQFYLNRNVSKALWLILEISIFKQIILEFLPSSVSLQSMREPWPPHTREVFLILFRHLAWLLWTSDQPAAKASTLYDNTAQKDEDNTHVLSGIRTHDLSVKRSQRGHWDLLSKSFVLLFLSVRVMESYIMLEAEFWIAISHTVNRTGIISRPFLPVVHWRIWGGDCHCMILHFTSSNDGQVWFDLLDALLSCDGYWRWMN